MKVNTATRESDEQFKTDKYLRCAVTNGKARLDFIPDLFFTPLADNMAASWLRQHSEYDGGSGLTGLFHRVSAGILHPTASSSLPRRPDISHLKVSSVTGCASREIISKVRSAPMQQALLPR
jgi:hypothetical protein